MCQSDQLIDQPIPSAEFGKGYLNRHQRLCDVGAPWVEHGRLHANRMLGPSDWAVIK